MCSTEKLQTKKLHPMRLRENRSITFEHPELRRERRMLPGQKQELELYTISNSIGCS
jgi:hypothetical protein